MDEWDVLSPKMVKQFIEDYLATHPCIVCGEDRRPVLQFHHRHPKDKRFQVSAHRGRPLCEVIEEIDKCDILCANCHWMYHHKYGKK